MRSSRPSSPLRTGGQPSRVRRDVIIPIAVMTTLIATLAATLAACSGPFGSGGPSPRTPTAATAPPADDPAQQASLARFYDQHVRWQDCADGLQCTTVTVPIDWSAPSGATLGLSVVRHRATGHRIGSLLINPGGPGVAGADWVRQDWKYFDDSLRTSYDLVGWDPRGTGGSDGISCESDSQLDTFFAMDATPGTPAEEQADLAANEAFAAGCKARAGAVFAHVDTLSTVKDMDVLRAVLGGTTLSYYGASYGTFLGAWYAQEFPWRVGRLVLDGAVDPSLDAQGYIDGQAMGFDRALTAYLTSCLSSGGCPFRGTPQQARDQLGALLAAADSTPLRTSTPSRPLTQALMATGIAYGMYATGLWTDLSSALTKALQGDGTALLAMADTYNGRDAHGHYDPALEAYSPIYCLDHPDHRTLAQLALDAAALGRTYPPLGDYIGWGAVTCLDWPVKAVMTPQRLSAVGAAPLLVVGTTGDPATPYEWAESLASQLTSARLLTRVGSGHTAYLSGSSCIDTVVDSYLLAGTLPPVGTTCH